MTKTKPRILSLDVIRGVAVCGILLMNIINFALPFGAYISPEIGLESGVDYLLFCLQHVLVDQKAMGLFSMLFGAGAVIFINNQIERTGNKSHYYWRMFWLLIIGLVHRGFNDADVLLFYALVGFTLPWFCRKSVRSLVWLAGLCFAMMVATNLCTQWVSLSVPNSGAALHDMLQGQFEPKLLGVALGIEFFVDVLCRSLGMMLLGMALYKQGFLIGQTTINSYRRVVLIFGSIGLVLVLMGLAFGILINFNLAYWLFVGRIFNLLATPLIAIAYVALIQLWLQSNGSLLIMGFASMGRMALTNYLMQTVIMLTVFQPWGLDWFNMFTRWQIWLMVCVILIGQMLMSVLWLKRFRYGPFEYLWRVLTYGKLHF